MAPRRFNEYRWYNLRQARDPDHLMKELTEIILDGLIPSEEEFVPVELDQTGGEGTPTDWTPSPLRGSHSRSNSPSPAGMLQGEGPDLDSEYPQPDGINIGQTLWGASSPSPARHIKTEDIYMEDIITQIGTEGHSDSAPFSVHKGDAPSTPKRALEFTAPRNKALRTGQGSLPSTPRTSTQSSTEQSNGEWETATEEKAERRRLLTSPGLWGLNDNIDRRRPQTPRVKTIRRGNEEDVLTVIENQAARLGDLSIENKQQAVKLGDLAGQNERLMQAVQSGKTEMSDMRDQIVRLTDLILLISNRTDPPTAPTPIRGVSPLEAGERRRCEICTGDSKGEDPCHTCGYPAGYVYPSDTLDRAGQEGAVDPPTSQIARPPVTQRGPQDNNPFAALEMPDDEPLDSHQPEPEVTDLLRKALVDESQGMQVDPTSTGANGAHIEVVCYHELNGPARIWPPEVEGIRRRIRADLLETNLPEILSGDFAYWLWDRWIFCAGYAAQFRFRGDSELLDSGNIMDSGGLPTINIKDKPLKLAPIVGRELHQNMKRMGGSANLVTDQTPPPSPLVVEVAGGSEGIISTSMSTSPPPEGADQTLREQYVRDSAKT